ncbi:MAG: hypothetical protein WD267_07570 [Balneolales bacterium]
MRLGLTLMASCILAGTSFTVQAQKEGNNFLIADRAEILALPTSGGAWNELLEAANNELSTNLADQNDHSPSFAVAAGLVYVRTGDPVYRDKIVQALNNLPGTEFNNNPRPGRTLSLGRQLAGWIIAADLIGYREPEFVAWVNEVRTSHIGNHGRWVNLTQTHFNAASNWGAFAGSSRVAASLYINDKKDVEAAAKILRGALGDRSSWPGLPIGENDGGFQPTAAFDTSWSCHNPQWQPLNSSCPEEKAELDGAIVEDIARSATSWPEDPDKTGYGYSWETLQGLSLQALLLSQNGYPDVWEWTDQGLLRAVDYLARTDGFDGENFHPVNYWVPWLIDAVYGSDYAKSGQAYGRAFGYTEWLAPALPKINK